MQLDSQSKGSKVPGVVKTDGLEPDLKLRLFDGSSGDHQGARETKASRCNSQAVELDA